ncbi:MAG: hypothetical protein M1827_006340 [Pycnora praestabilis]|nr:MAG: hypothetical protein M1827_006340 [Pycnora praestabilis]
MSNQAAWIPSAKSQLKVDSAPMPQPGPEEVVVKNAFIAINPVDWKIQDTGFVVKNYPNILGTDVAGEVVEVGSSIQRFKKGDRVLAHALGLADGKPEHGGFQLYTAVSEIVTAHIPSSLSFEKASVLPLSLSTAAAGLYQEGYLELPYPAKNAKSAGKSLLIWGGSSSVGSSAIQLAVASGVTVLTTASAKNQDYVKGLGAHHVFDHSSPAVVDHIVKSLKDSSDKFAGAYDAISEEATVKQCAQVVHDLGGGKIATVLPPPEGLPSDVQAVGVFATTVATKNKDVGNAIWRDFVPQALEDGHLQAKPDPLVIKGGLPKVQEGLDKLRKGVSAAKVVIEL